MQTEFFRSLLGWQKPVSLSQASILHYSGLSITYDEAPISFS
jgi:hypothetical protein